MAISTDLSTVSVVAATSLEARAVRRELPNVRVHETGVALARVSASTLGDAVISCGLAGGLRTDLGTGTVLVPTQVRTPSGEMLPCDDALVAALIDGARRLGHEPVTAPLITSSTIVRGTERAVWAERGYAGVDMESGLITAPRMAVIRVVLDTPLRELSADWLRPATAFLRPKNWPEAWWLAREAPRAAQLAARVLRVALEHR